MSAEPVAQAWQPLCMDADEWADWQRLNPTREAVRFDRDVTDRPCADCPLGYAAEMRAVSRCNGQPGAVEEDEDMDDQPEPKEAPRGLSLTRRVALELAVPPCASCAHEPVCSLRIALEGMATVDAQLLPLPAGLRLELAATVECDHFLRDRAKPAPVRVLTSQERGQANSHRARRPFSPEGLAKVTAANRLRAERQRAAREGAATA